jgi:hypothetical protein
MTISEKELLPASSSKRKEIIRRLFGRRKEKFPVVEIPEVPEVPIEVERRVTPISGAATQLKKPVTDDQTGQVLVTSTTAQTPKIVLPLTKDEIEAGLTVKLVNSVRWLAEWCLRLVKKAAFKIKLKKE